MDAPSQDTQRALTALIESVAIADFSSRTRLCVVGADRGRFLHGQVTNGIENLEAGHGCYTAITTSKGKFQADANVHVLADEILLDMEPGMAKTVTKRLETYIVSDDVEVVDVTDSHHMIASIGPLAATHIERLFGKSVDAVESWGSLSLPETEWGEVYIFCRPVCGRKAFNVLVDSERSESYVRRAVEIATELGGGVATDAALDAARIEAAVPRFGVDFGESHLVPEAGIEGEAVSYRKGCYIGQETLNRIRAIGRVNKKLIGWEWTSSDGSPPPLGSRILDGEKTVGQLTSVLKSWRLDRSIALGYARRDYWEPGVQLRWSADNGASGALAVVETPFDASTQTS